MAEMGNKMARHSSPGPSVFQAFPHYRTHRNYLQAALSHGTLDDGTAPLGNGEMTILKDMECLDQEHDQYMQDLKSGAQSD